MSFDQIDGDKMSRPISTTGPYTPAAVEFGRRLQQYTAEKGWSQADLARAATKFLGKDKVFRRDSLSLYMRGAQMPGPARLHALCRALGIKQEDLIPPDTSDTPPPLAMKPIGDGGNVWLQINQAVSMKTALEIAGLLKKGIK